MMAGSAEVQSDIAVRFLAEGEQTGADVAGWLAGFIGGTRRTLDIAIYDCRLSDALKAIFVEALRERALAGVQIRIAYDADKPESPNYDRGMDPAPSGTGQLIQSLGYPFRPISGEKLMHHKYLVRDAGTPQARVWTGSTNLTDDAWTLQENNIVQLASPALADGYARDFADLWTDGDIANTGANDGVTTVITNGGAPARVRALFSPGCGELIDEEVARLIRGARRRVRICSMLLNAGHLINALRDLLEAGQVQVDGIYDQTQMQEVFVQWQDVPHNHWKIGAIQAIVRDAGLTGKVSTPYTPTSRHDFMHNKVLIVDDTVITGSYNFSRSAELNAENILFIESPALAERYSQYVDHLIARYGSARGG